MVGSRIANVVDRRLAAADRARLEVDDFTLVANDCFGGAVYQRMGVTYRTPFVGLMMMAPDFLTLAENLEEAVAAPLTFRTSSRHANVRERHGHRPGFPVGYLGGEIELLFVHYASEAGARSTWERRRERMAFDDVLLKFDGSKDLADEDSRERFEALPYGRKLMLVRDDDRHPAGVAVPGWVEDGHRVLRPLLQVFDIVDWINGAPRPEPRPAVERRLRRIAA